MRIQRIDEVHKADINIQNEIFSLRGKMLVSFHDGKWHHREEYFPENEISEMIFPDENYVFEDMKDYIFLGAYEGDECVGLAILAPIFNPCLFLYDLKVKKDFRKMGIGRQLIEASLKIAYQKGYAGLYTVGQDNNVNACLFYLDCGFEIGGLDTAIYEGTAQAGKCDIMFYKR